MAAKRRCEGARNAHLVLTPVPMTMLCAPRRIAPPMVPMTGHRYWGYGLRKVRARVSTRGGGTFEHSCDVGSVSPRRPLIRAPERDADSGNHRRERDGPQVGVVDLAPVDDLAARLGGGVGTHRTRARICSRFPRRTERTKSGHMSGELRYHFSFLVPLVQR